MYKHTVQYYETDKMGVTHHSNYVRWMEEARVDYLYSIGMGYDKLEEQGIVSPVVGISVDYKKTTTFADEISIELRVTEFSGIKLKFEYTMTDKDGNVVCTASSLHCFLHKDGSFIRMKKEFPELFEMLTKELEK